MTGTRQTFNRSTIQSNIDFDFTERIYDVHFYSFLDLFARLGGLRASILPIIGYFMPILSLHFLWVLSGIVDKKMHQNQENELFQLITVAMKQFKQVKKAGEKGRIRITAS